MPRFLWLLLFAIDAVLAALTLYLALAGESLRPAVISSFLVLVFATTFYLLLNKHWLKGVW